MNATFPVESRILYGGTDEIAVPLIKEGERG